MEELCKILIVDDEEEIRFLIKLYLEKKGYSVIEAGDGLEAVQKVEEIKDLDLIVLDIMMPNMSGTQACAKIREISSAPVLFLTAKTQEPDKEEAYHNGGDDFLAKPFTQSELLRKVNALIRRYRVYDDITCDQGALKIGTITVDFKRRMIFRNKENIKLANRELDLLLYLVQNRGKVCSIEELYENVWKEQFLPTSANTIMVHILRLRQKVEENPEVPLIIRTVYGKGYQVD